MAAPEYVPVKPAQRVRVYQSPPRRPQPWLADRPADLVGRQPHGARLGNQGPDQGYVYVLADRLRSRLHLQPGEHEHDVIAGCCAVALKRASLLGRAPVIHDLNVAATLFGFLDPSPPDDLVALRLKLFTGVRHPHHYSHLLRIPDSVHEGVLREPHTAIIDKWRAEWRELIDTSAAEAGD